MCFWTHQMACFAWADSASCLHYNSVRGVQRSGDVIEGLVSCTPCKSTIPPTRFNLYKSAVVFTTGKQTSSLKLGQATSVVSGKPAHGGGCTCVQSFNMLSPSLKAVVLALCHIRAPHWGDEAAHAAVSQCISLLTPRHICVFTWFPPCSNCRYTIMGNSCVISRINRAHTHTHTNKSKSTSPILTLVLWPDAAATDFTNPWGRRKARLRTEGNDSIWPGHMATKESPEERLWLDPNPQQATKWSFLPVFFFLAVWFWKYHFRPASE